jgi:hypothetical protein
MGVSSQRHASAALPPGKTLGTHLTPGLVWKGGKNLSPTGIFFSFAFSCTLFVLHPNIFIFLGCPPLKHNTNIHAPSGIPTCNPSKRPAADPRLRPFGHWNRQIRFQDRPARSHLLHWLSYPGPPPTFRTVKKTRKAQREVWTPAEESEPQHNARTYFPTAHSNMRADPVHSESSISVSPLMENMTIAYSCVSFKS